MGEFAEEKADFVLRDADSRVAYREAQKDIAFIFFQQRGADRHLASMDKLDGVARQIIENLAQAASVAPQQHGYLCIGGAEQFDPLFMGAYRYGVGQVVQQTRQIEVQQLKHQLLRIDLREVKDVVEQTEQ